MLVRKTTAKPWKTGDAAGTGSPAKVSTVVEHIITFSRKTFRKVARHCLLPEQWHEYLKRYSLYSFHVRPVRVRV